MNKDNKPRGKQEMIQDGSFKLEKKSILFFNINTIILVIIFMTQRSWKMTLQIFLRISTDVTLRVRVCCNIKPHMYQLFSK